jgi:4-hydroxythreonine-4-phosphate dehydrogenase
LKPKSKIKTLIAITMGDPAGIGAEVALKAVAKLLPKSNYQFVLVGDYRHWISLAQKLRIRMPIVWINDVELARSLPKGVGALDFGGVKKINWGKTTSANGAAAVNYIAQAARIALAGDVNALVTAPINKESIHKAGCPFPGHTELLADLSGTRDFAMMMVGGPFKIVLQSIHLSLKDSITKIKPALVWEKLNLTHQTLQKWFGISQPRIAVAGVNPHAGENGAFGKEEIEILKPIVKRAQAKGWKVSGPHPPDTLFYWAGQGRYDAVLCMYHDQGLIPLKLAAFDSGVNLTLGLPFIRTSPDHGTAFDIAGKGIANPSSMVSAIELAGFLSRESVK